MNIPREKMKTEKMLGAAPWQPGYQQNTLESLRTLDSGRYVTHLQTVLRTTRSPERGRLGCFHNKK